jgi:hypothetical protein
MHNAVSIEPTAVYDDGALFLSLGLSANVLSAARRDGTLRFTRKGHRTLYLGRWVLDWLEEEAPERREARRAQ